MISQGGPPGSSSAWWNWVVSQGGGGGSDAPPPGSYADWLNRTQGGGGGYGPGNGYYGTGGGMGYIGGGPSSDAAAWELFLAMRRNGWDVNNPFGVDEARRGMGDFTNEKSREYFYNWIMNPENHNPDGSLKLGKGNEWMLNALGGGLLGKLGLDDWIRKQQSGATVQDWLLSLDDHQQGWILNWLDKTGADKNWNDRFFSGDAPWSRGDQAGEMISRQNPKGQDPYDRDDRPGGPRLDKPKKKGKGGGGGEKWTPPPYAPLYEQQLKLNPYFLAWQPTNTGGPVQFVPGKG